MRVFIGIIIVLALASCSVLILNHSNSNVIDDDTEPVVKTKVSPHIEMRSEKSWHIGKEINDTVK